LESLRLSNSAGEKEAVAPIGMIIMKNRATIRVVDVSQNNFGETIKQLLESTSACPNLEKLDLSGIDFRGIHPNEFGVGLAKNLSQTPVRILKLNNCYFEISESFLEGLVKNKTL